MIISRLYTRPKSLVYLCVAIFAWMCLKTPSHIFADVEDTPVWVSPDIKDTRSVVWGDADGDGDLDLAIGNRNQPNQLYVNDGNGTYTIITIGDQPSLTTSLAWGDSDGDGDLDLAVGNENEPNRIYINNGNNTFSDVALDTLTNNTTTVAWGDSDGDGDLDLAIGNNGQANLLYVNNGTGTLTRTTLNADTKPTESIAWGDADGDGDLDLAVGNSFSNNYQKNQLYINDGSGNFTVSDIGAETDYSVSVSWGDADGDGDLDLAVGNLNSINKLYINDGSGTFSGQNLGTTAGTSRDVVWGDNDGDGDLDLAVMNTYATNEIYINQGGIQDGILGDFLPKPIGAEDGKSVAGAWGDADGDGDLDLAVGKYFVGDRSAQTQSALGHINYVYLNNGLAESGVLGGLVSGDIGDSNSTWTVAWGDADGDGDLDLARGDSHSRGQVYFNDGQGGFTPSDLGQIDGQNTQSIAWGDADGDGDLDLALGHQWDANQLFVNDGNGNFTDFYFEPTNVWTSSMVWGDVDGDGDLDVAVGNYRAKNQLYVNDGNGTFTVQDIDTVSTDTNALAWGDLDGDGDLDLAAANNGFNQLYINDGVGNFAVQNLGAIVRDSNSVAWGDGDGDGDLDLAIGNKFQPNQLYVNEGDLTPQDLDADAFETFRVAWGDMDGDGDLDLAVGNHNEADQILINQGGGVFRTAQFEQAVNRTRDLAWGDADGDGDLDLAIGGTFQPIQLMENQLSGALPIANRPTKVAIEQLSATDYYGTALIEERLNIPINFVLYDEESDDVGKIRMEYSIDGGGVWRDAVPTDGTVTRGLTTAPYPTQNNTNSHTFVWDTFASGFFGQADQVVVRMIVSAQTDDGVTGEFEYTDYAPQHLYPSLSTATMPFRVHGTQVRVFDETIGVGNEAEGAVVYLKPEGQSHFEPMGDSQSNLPFVTDDLGYLQGRGVLGVGDELVALWPVDGNEAYTRYHTSASVDADGFADAYQLNAGGVHDVVVSAANTLLLFDLVVSLEWDARDDSDYLLQLQADLGRASEILYDLSNGQAALGDITIYHDREEWNFADLVIHASNDVRPSAIAGGIVLTSTTDVDVNGTIIENAYVPGQIRMGATWNRFGEPGGTLGEDWPRTLAHEFGHYLFHLPDNYLGINPTSGLLLLTDCVGSIMTDPYTNSYSEFLTAADWTGDCQNTLAEVYMGRTDWETINTFYPFLNSTNMNSGPAYLPLATTTIDFVEPTTVNQPLPDLYITLQAQDGSSHSIPSGRGEAFLTKVNGSGTVDNHMQHLGSPVNNIVHARGAEIGDRLCVYDFSQDPLLMGCHTFSSTSTSSITMIPRPNWKPTVKVTEVNSQTFSVTVSDVNDTVMSVQLYPSYGPASTNYSMNASGSDFEKTISLAEPAFAGYARVWVPGSNPRKEIFVDFISIEDWAGKSLSWGGKSLSWGGKSLSWGGKSLSWGAPTMSTDGQVMLFPLDNPFADTTVYNLQKMTFAPDLPSWLTPIGQAYRVEVDGDMPDGSIIFRYLGRDIDSVYEDDLAVYYSPDDGVTWERRVTEVDQLRNHATAQANDAGIYVLVATLETAFLVQGWNNVSYNGQAVSVQEALASIEGVFETVYWYDDANAEWYHYGASTQDPFGVVVDTLEVMVPDAYWIYVTQPITWYVGIDTGIQTREAQNVVIPPAFYYGWVSEVDGIGVGSVVEARIDGVLCGETTVLELDGQLAYALQASGEAFLGPSNGCGLAGRDVTISVDGLTRATVSWENEMARKLDLMIVPTAVGVSVLTAEPAVLPLLLAGFALILLGVTAVTRRRVRPLEGGF